MKIISLVLVLLIALSSFAFAFETYGNEEVFVKDGVTYIIGHPTPQQLADEARAREEMFKRNEERLEKEQARRDALEAERIRARK